MEINSLLKLRNHEKKDCKVTTNGVIWLRKGEYSSQIKQDGRLRPKLQGSTKNAAELRISEVQSLLKKEPNYFRENNPRNYIATLCNKNKRQDRNKLYSVNKRKVRARLINFSNTEYGNKKMYFYSISFPLGMDEKLSTKLLNSVLTTLRKDYGIEHYLWVAERQKKGQKHYHLCLFHYVKARVVNEIVKKYIKHAIRKKGLNWSNAAANKYNGVDISKDRKTGIPTNFTQPGKQRNIASYITKYISKSSGNFEGQAWNCSRSVASVTDGICCTIEEVLTMYSSEILNDNASYESEWCYFFRWKKEAPPDIMSALFAVNNELITASCSPLRGIGI